MEVKEIVLATLSNLMCLHQITVWFNFGFVKISSDSKWSFD